MEFRDESETGRYAEILPTLHRRIGQYQRGGRPIKVGATYNPNQRARDHASDGWREMVLIYSTSSKSHVSAVEKDLIDHGWRNNYYSLNYNPGGEGILPGYTRYYIYVLLR